MNGFRHENKYFISQAGYELLRTRLAALMQTDANAVRSDGTYLIRSLYFDDFCQSGLIDKSDGIQNREKFRIRFYNNDPSFIRLESKQKWTDLTRKESARLTRRQTEALLHGDCWSLYDSEDPLLRSFYLKMRTRLLRPVVLVDYEREAYLFRDVRITFDKNLHSGRYYHGLFDPDFPTVPVFPDDRMILEVKYDDCLPDCVFQLLHGVSAVRCAISKYALCRALQ